MTRYITEDEAKQTPCPIARTFAEGKSPNCDGKNCMLWRWREIMATDQVYISAVRRAAASIAQDMNETDDPAKAKKAGNYHKEAVAMVTRDPEGWDVITRFGYCGLGGKP